MRNFDDYDEKSKLRGRSRLGTSLTIHYIHTHENGSLHFWTDMFPINFLKYVPYVWQLRSKCTES